MSGMAPCRNSPLDHQDRIECVARVIIAGLQLGNSGAVSLGLVGRIPWLVSIAAPRRHRSFARNVTCDSRGEGDLMR